MSPALGLTGQLAKGIMSIQTSEDLLGGVLLYCIAVSRRCFGQLPMWAHVSLTSEFGQGNIGEADAGLLIMKRQGTCMRVYKCKGIAHVYTHIHTLTNSAGQAWGANLPLTPHALLTQPRVLLSSCTPTHAHTQSSWVQKEGGWRCEPVCSSCAPTILTQGSN